MIPEQSKNNDSVFNLSIRYVEKVTKKNPSKKDSILSSYEDDDKEAYDPNWADVF
jgi:hypothetical protein